MNNQLKGLKPNIKNISTCQQFIFDDLTFKRRINGTKFGETSEATGRQRNHVLQEDSDRP